MKITAKVESGTKVFYATRIKRTSEEWVWDDGMGWIYTYDVNSECIFKKLKDETKNTLAYKNVTEIKLDYQE